MMRRRILAGCGRLGGWTAVLVTVLALPGRSEDKPRPAPPLAHASLAPALRRAAERDGIRLFAWDGAASKGEIGDTVVAWIGTRKGSVVSQWLVALRRDVAKPGEEPPSRRTLKKYLSWGSVVTFEPDPEWLDVWIAGPVDMAAAAAEPAAPAATRRVRVAVGGAYLRLGLDESLRVDAHLRRAAEKAARERPGFRLEHIYSLSEPIKPEAIARAKPVAEVIGFTPEMERAWVGGFVALQEFYQVVEHAPALREIAEVALEKPPAWKLAKLAFGSHFRTSLGGKTTQEVEPAKLGLPPVATQTFQSVFELALDKDLIGGGILVVTAPVPPLDVSAGILGLLAVHPKDPTRMVHLAVISGLRGAARVQASGAAAAPRVP